MKKVEGAARIMENLIDLAISDKVVNAEEKAILQSINDNLHNYLKNILEQFGERIYSPEKLKRQEKMLVAKCEEAALRDGKISPDEKALLDELKSLIEDLGNLI